VAAVLFIAAIIVFVMGVRRSKSKQSRHPSARQDPLPSDAMSQFVHAGARAALRGGQDRGCSLLVDWPAARRPAATARRLIHSDPAVDGDRDAAVDDRCPPPTRLGTAAERFRAAPAGVPPEHPVAVNSTVASMASRLDGKVP
jgi:hypothetical protein